ncbi:MAG TPA: class I SAM-dependent methyltransferase [Stellaceae bacterium]|nr:class I SAM-dependent methyltransferase [Stellaceae bacterium]
MEKVVCNLCGGDRSRFVYRQPDALFFPDRWFDVVECLQCGLGFVNPRPTISEMAEYYPAAFFSSFNDPAHAQRYAAEARFLPVAGVTGVPRLLDVGCANGDFPRFMKARGWDVEGVELSPNAAAIADFPVYRSEFSAAPIDGPRYDAVTAWGVLEHVHDPMAYFRKAAQVLRPGGRFVFLVPNFDSLSSRALFREDVPRHLYFFTAETLRRYSETAGLRLRELAQSREVYEMIPSNVTYHLFSCWLRGRALRWEDLPEARNAYLRRLGLADASAKAVSPLHNLRYALTHPLAAVDRVVSKLFERWQLARGTYGMMIGVAERPAAR